MKISSDAMLNHSAGENYEENHVAIGVQGVQAEEATVD